MWRIFSYPVLGFTSLEGAFIGILWIWAHIGLPVDNTVSSWIFGLGAGLCIVGGPFIGYEAAERAQAKHEAQQKWQNSQDEKTAEYERTKSDEQLKYDRKQREKFERLVGPEPPETVIPIDRSKEKA